MRCPITYKETTNRYAPEAIKLFSSQATILNDFPFSVEEQLQEAVARASKMSIQGMQPKLSTVFSLANGSFEIVDSSGTFIMKPQHLQFKELPENEDLSMRLAKSAGAKVPFHGMIYCSDGTLTYFIKRFDRLSRGKKLPVEDFAQLLGFFRETKYAASMERVAEAIERFCTFPAIEKIELFRRVLISFLVGNEDMHLKNFSLITEKDITTLSPVYDMVNTTIALHSAKEEIALPIKGNKKNLTRAMFFKYFAKERLQLRSEVVDKVAGEITAAVNSAWPQLIEASFMSDKMKKEYEQIVNERRTRLGL